MRAQLVCTRYSSWVPLYDSLRAAFGGCIFSGWAATGSQHFDSLRDAPRLHGDKRAHRYRNCISNSDLVVSLHRTSKYVILSGALAKSKNLRIFSAAKQCFGAKIPRLRSG